MANIVALIKDDRVRRAVELYLGELEMDLRLATFKTIDEFKSFYFRTPDPDRPPVDGTDAESVEEGAELKLFSEVHMVIYALDSIGGEKSGAFIERLWANMQKFKHFPADGQPIRLVLLKYEDDNVSKLDVLHPHLDDLIYLPLDRLVFLQKMQILLSLPKRVSPRYLFNQEVKAQIEVSKIARLERLSDVGLAIRNPVPLKKGLPGHFYITLPGEKAPIEIQAKVLRSDSHPEFPGQFLVFFSYFGLSKNGLSALRRTLSKFPHYKSLLSDDREKFRYRPDDLFLEESSRHMYGVVIIDTDEAAGTSMALTLNKEMDRLNVSTESSYQMFLHRYLDDGGSQDRDATPPRATDDTDFYSHPISLTVSAGNLGCLSVDPGPDDAALFLGHPAAIIFSSPDKWFSLIQEKASRLIMEEAAQLASQGRVLHKLLTMQDSRNQRCAVNCKIYCGVSEGTLTVELHPATLADIVERAQSDLVQKNVEALIVDAGFAPAEPTGWIEGIRSRAVQVAMVQSPGQLKFWLVSESEKIERGWLNCPDVLGVFIKPVDQRQLLFSLSENLQNKNTVYQFENLGWTQPGINLHVAKDIEIEALSEFGATLKSRQPIQPGNMLYLRKLIYENAPNQCLAARVYACEENPSEKGTYHICTTYFGINDAFLKFARTWIRENYAHQKSKE